MVSMSIFTLFQEIGECAALLETECVALSSQLGALRVLLLHSGLGGAAQHLYSADGDESQTQTNQEEKPESCLRRRVILTDSLGEATFSLPNIRYVIDTGLELKTVSLQQSTHIYQNLCSNPILFHRHCIYGAAIAWWL